jgi:uracil-DNA glycosylase family 4
MEVKARELKVIQGEIERCRLCPRLVEWRELIARQKVRRFADQDYWGKGVPSFGDPKARLLVLGLAPAAHGANRTGRMFTGDGSGNWLYRALHRAGFANQPASTDRRDGLTLTDCYISAAIHCAPPANKPLPDEVSNCRDYLVREVECLTELRVVVALGRLAFDAAIATIGGATREDPAGSRINRPSFAHGATCKLARGLTMIASYHPSQQNTFTGKLTEPMFDSIFSLARSLLEQPKRARYGRNRPIL